MSESEQLQPLISCEECGLVVELPPLEDGEKASCPRCQHTLAKRVAQPFQRPLSYGIASLAMLVASISFPFMSFSVQGISQEITLMHSAKMLSEFENSLLALLLLATVVVLPALYLSVLLYLYVRAGRLTNSIHKNASHKPISHFEKQLCRVMIRIEPWLMVDVFLIGVLVSLIKIASLADIGLGLSFWAFCIYTILVVKCVSMVDRTWLWMQFIPITPLQGVSAGDSHQSKNHISCHICAQMNPMASEDSHERCHRCHGALHPYSPKQMLQRSWALLIAAAVFFIPANLYPMMYTVSLGNSEGSTIMGGVILLWQLKSYPIAAVIFLASVVIPLAKIFALTWLYFHAHKSAASDEHQAIQKLRLYRITELIGRWSMIDIFVVAILVALVQLQNLMAIFPGPAALSFACVVLLTMLSAMTFDPRVFWVDQVQEKEIDENLNNTNESSGYE
ncbi:paraquat-inducible protein A [Photobacterium sanctipauli]|uniref:Paraquat-inducible protein A n=2 Tax=Photobacterium sanctipauli TaxID=1342794 RepID=A0A2T3NUH5_9GAMM|nr:paraquat-inducible protein A [Photobacterium sanctipauli]PSW19907.1 paraquat-inducible protein A [Photobacterium sanctipauli]